jgi:fermentation-respiration switch protein FrsA (DUF1100 family)
LVAYVAVAALAYVFQRRLLYFPDSSAVPLPSGREYAGLEEFSVTAADGTRLEGWYWPASSSDPTPDVDLLIFHGNGGHRGHRLEWMEMLRPLGCGICIVDYRGYGGSEGSPTEEGLYADAEAALAWLQARGPGKLVYFGESLGTGVAVELARRHPPTAMILQSGFSSAVEVGQAAFPFLPVKLFLRDRYDNLSKLPEVQAPVLVIHGDRDRVVPLRFGRRLFEATLEPKEWLEIPGADHNDLPWVATRDYLARLKDFLARHIGAED